MTYREIEDGPVADVRREHVLRVWASNGYNTTQTAQQLELSRPGLQKILDRLNLTRPIEDANPTTQ